MSNSVQRLRRQIPLKKGDLIISAIIAIPIYLFITGFDIFMHDTFVLPTYHCDQASDATKPECKPIVDKTAVTASIAGTTFQYEIQGRQQYWIWFSGVSVALPLLLASMRAFFGRSISAGAMWFLTIFLPVYAMEDYGYYALRSMPVPDQLPWLDGHVLISNINSFVNPGSTHVMASALYATIAVAIGFLAIAWYVVLRKQKK